MEYKIQDQLTWKRKQQFDFYNNFSEPFFGLAVDIDITGLYLDCKEQGSSIFIAYLHQILTVLNDIEEFRYRIHESEVRIYDTIGVSATVARDNETFGFSYIDYHSDRSVFTQLVTAELDRVKRNTDFSPATDKLNLVHFSSIPWVKFTALSHARHYDFPDYIPKISTGKIYQQDNKYFMPVSVHVHHGLMDALQVSRLFNQLELRTAN